MRCGEASIHQVNERDEGDQHRGDIEREMQSIDCSTGNGSEYIGNALHLRDLDAAYRQRRFLRFSGPVIFASAEWSSGAVMMTAA